MRRFHLGLAAVLLLGASLPQTLFAQVLPGNSVLAPTSSGAPSFQSAPGIRLGDGLVLHAGLGLEFRYDSNVFYNSDKNGEHPTGSALMRVLPSMNLGTTAGEARLWAMQWALAFDYREYLTSNDFV